MPDRHRLLRRGKGLSQAQAKWVTPALGSMIQGGNDPTNESKKRWDQNSVDWCSPLVRDLERTSPGLAFQWLIGCVDLLLRRRPQHECALQLEAFRTIQKLIEQQPPRYQVAQLALELWQHLPKNPASSALVKLLESYLLHFDRTIHHRVLSFISPIHLLIFGYGQMQDSEGLDDRYEIVAGVFDQLSQNRS